MVAAVGRALSISNMNASKWNWLPQWPVVPPRLWLTAAATIIAGLSLLFEKEIWSPKATAELWSFMLLVFLMPVGGIQLIRMLRVWQREYRGPGWMRLLMWGAILPVYGAVLLLILGFALILCFSLGNIRMD